MSRRALICAGIGYGLLRWVLLVQPGYVYDVAAYKRWGLQAARFGISQVYAKSDMDYPPLYAYLLAPLGHIYGWLSPDALANLRDSTLLTALAKLPPLLFDLGIAWILYRLARRVFSRSLGSSSARRAGTRSSGAAATASGAATAASHAAATAPGAPLSATGAGRWAWILPAAYLLNPAVLFNDAYWGEPDSVHSFFLLAAFLTLAYGLAFWRRQPEDAAHSHTSGCGLAWVCLALATLMKPLGAPFWPLFLVLSLARCGPRRTLFGIAAAAGIALLVFLPFLAAGVGPTVFHRVLGDVRLMAYTSSNAHNLWWLLGSWRNSEIPWLGPLTATQVALILFGALYAALLWQAHRLHRAQAGGLVPDQILALAAMLGFSFFMLATHMHENHMFMVLPLLAPLLPRGRWWQRLFVAASLAVFANLALHDLGIPQHWPFTLGGVTRIENLDFKRPFFAFELTAIWISTAFNLALYAAFLFWFFRPAGRGWLAKLGRADSG